MCNGFHYPRGGAEAHYLELSALLESHGHEVIPFSTQHENNLPSEYSSYFLSHTDYPSFLGGESTLSEKVQVVERVVYSREAKQKIEQLIADTKPDIAHLHNIAHYISPSILSSIKNAGIPIAMTLHDYKLLCPNTHFLSKGKVCERCKIHRYYNVFLRRCKRDSLSASFLAGVEMYVHKALQLHERYVDVYIAPSEFLADKMCEYGINKPIVHLPNFIDLKHFEVGKAEGDYSLYFGRLSEEKGLTTLLEAMQVANTRSLVIAGTGPDESHLRKFAEDKELTNVSFSGHLSKDRLIPLIQGAAFTLFPSEWYENYPLAILESFACGKPVIASDIGAIPGLIKDGWNGILFQPGDAYQLAEKIDFMFEHPGKANAMGRNGRKQVERTNNPEDYYKQTISLYGKLLSDEVIDIPLPSNVDSTSSTPC
jgi:glycosyltransferase involved in cell wall biosynthesis